LPYWPDRGSSGIDQKVGHLLEVVEHHAARRLRQDNFLDGGAHVGEPGVAGVVVDAASLADETTRPALMLPYFCARVFAVARSDFFAALYGSRLRLKLGHTHPRCSFPELLIQRGDRQPFAHRQL
jgi:hypothetical protein